METNYTPGADQPVSNLLGISLEGETRSKLETITTWSKITAIGGFANMALNIISTVITLNRAFDGTSTTWLISSTLISLIISFFLNLFLWQFSKHLKFSLDNENQESFVAAATQLKAYMRMLGILLIVSIALGILGSLSLGSAFSRF